MRCWASRARATRTLAAVVFVALIELAAVGTSPAWSADAEVIIRATALDPHVLSVPAGQRVSFVKRVDRPVHVEFGADPKQHQIFQIPGTAPISAIFHRPGTHSYVVHIYDGKTTVLHGLVEVTENPNHPWELGQCGAVVEESEACIEP